jgi:hypothetical protein
MVCTDASQRPRKGGANTVALDDDEPRRRESFSRAGKKDTIVH